MHTVCIVGSVFKVYVIQVDKDGTWEMYNRNGFKCSGIGYEGRGQIAERIFKDLEVA